MKLNELKNKKILILGFGREGRDTFYFLRKLFPDKILAIGDKEKISGLKDKKMMVYSGNNYLKSLKDFDLIFKSPGIPIHLPEIERSFKEGKITSQTKVFLENCPGKIIGVTGTKGKSTTSSLIYRILKNGGIKSYLIGNIEKPVLSYLLKAKKDDVFVCELSSHQLYNLEKSPHIAVFLNVYPEHLDYYKNLKEYSRAKANIAVHQGKNDFLIYNSGNKIVREIAKKSEAKKIPIKGEYYDLDKKAAIEAAKIFKVPNNIILKTIKEFKNLPYRMELVGTFKGIDFYNDALATIPEATMGAIESLGDRVETIMLGGFERNIDFKNLAKKILKSKIKNVILFPTTGKKIWKDIVRSAGNRGVPKHFFTDNMGDAVRLAFENTGKGKTCLLSTASSSFSIFRDYREKGDLFKKYAREYGKR
ncbi:MAG: Mur ligase family protein [Candidatus Nealsonbacteria bacterium]|nr:Mur ligase family protein [Candidatus Nealsonbacteria bacterium]